LGANLRNEFHEDSLSALGMLFVNWTFAQTWLKSLVVLLAGDTLLIDAILHDLDTVRLQAALNAASHKIADREVASRLNNAAELYFILCGYWIYWSRYTEHMVQESEVRAGTADDMEERKPGFHFRATELANLRRNSADCYELGLFARQLTLHLRQRPDNGGAIPPMPSLRRLPLEVEQGRYWQ
jgi:hypothetical protein